MQQRYAKALLEVLAVFSHSHVLIPIPMHFQFPSHSHPMADLIPIPVVYRSGSAATSTEFFTEMTDVLDRLSTFAESVYMVGDLKPNSERPTRLNSTQLNWQLS